MPTDTPLSLPDCLNHRRPETHKGDYGHALLIAGSLGKMGAALLAAKACLRAGAGLLTVHVPRCGADILQTAFPEAMLSVDPSVSHASTLPDGFDRFSAVAIGPGLGTHADTALLLQQVLTHCTVPLILDADALNLVARHQLHHLLSPDTIITPHAKEYERLFGESDPSAMAQRHSIVIVKKSHRTQIYAPTGEHHTNTTGNPGMATAGSGDVLTGILLGLAAQRLPPYQTAIIGTYIHGKSGDLAVQKQSQASLIASDIIENIKFSSIS